MKRFLRIFIYSLILVGGLAVSNEYYQATGAPAYQSQFVSSVLRAEYALIMAALDKLPVLTGNANEVVTVNSGGTGLTSTPVQSMLTSGGVENTGNKDVSGGYAGLTLRKINFKNVLGTFTSFFTNSNTAARTYTFQDRDGTIVDNTDLALKANAATVAADMATKANIDSQTFTGSPKVPTPAAGDNTTQIPNTAWVQAEVETEVVSGLAAMPENRGLKNYLINGNFDVWEYPSTTQTTNGYGSDNRWWNGHNGNSKTHSRGAFTDFEYYSGSPVYYSRTQTTAISASTNYTFKEQRIFDVRRMAGETVTVSFIARAGTSGKKIGVNFYQDFGSGGSESTQTAITGESVNITTSFAIYSVTLTIPSVAGKTIVNAEDSYTALRLWFSAGSSFSAQSGSVPHQSDTFDIGMVQVEEGLVATAFERRALSEEQRLCRWFYQAGQQPETYNGIISSGATAWYQTIDLFSPMRSIPEVTLSDWRYYSNGSSTVMPSLTLARQTTGRFTVRGTGMVNVNGLTGNGTWTASAEL